MLFDAPYGPASWEINKTLIVFLFFFLSTNLKDLIGISRQATVIAFQLGDGFTNMITPTSGVLIGVLGIAKIPYEKWFSWMLPLQLILFVAGLLLLIPPVLFQWGPF